MAWTAILTASLVNPAQLAASLAALFRQRHYDDPTWRIFGSAVPAAPTWQPKVIKEFKPLTQNKTLPHHVGGFLRFLDYAACLELDLNVNTSGKVKTHQRINRSGVGVENVDKTLVCTHLKLIA